MPALPLPDPALIAVIGAASAGKSTFMARHFAPDELFTSADLEAVAARLRSGQRAVVEAAAVRPDERRALVALARAHDLPAVAVVLDLPRPLLEARQAARGLDAGAVLAQVAELRRTSGALRQEGFRQAHVLRSPQEVGAVQVRRVPLAPDRSDLRGPFDFIGDVHGCLPELRELLSRLGYDPSGEGVTPPPGRTAVFLGDLTDRGPDSAGVLRLVMEMVRRGAALCVAGNHDEKLRRALEGRSVNPDHGLEATLEALGEAGVAFRRDILAFLTGLPDHLVLDGGRVVAAHAGLPERYHGRVGGRVRSFTLYGDVSGQTDEFGLPVRRDWAADYQGRALVVYGHTPHTAPRWLNHTVNIDTGCAFGGALTALRYPEREQVSVPARAQYAAPRRPLAQP